MFGCNAHAAVWLWLCLDSGDMNIVLAMRIWPISANLPHMFGHMSTTNVYHKCSDTCLPQMSTTNVHHKRLPQVSTTNIYHKRLPQMSTTNVYNKCLPQTSTTNVYHKCLLQICCLSICCFNCTACAQKLFAWCIDQVALVQLQPTNPMPSMLQPQPIPSILQPRMPSL